MGRVNTTKLETIFPKARLDAQVASCLSFGIGGRVAGVLEVSRPEDLVQAIGQAQASKLPFRVIAGGSNILWPDKFYPGLVICFRNPKSKVKVEGVKLEVEAGLPLAKLVSASVNAGLAGLESLSGIPGTVGGAIVGNAGAYGHAISDFLVAVEYFDLSGGKVKWLEKKACRFAYRDSIFKHKEFIVLRARFELVPGNKEELVKKSQEIIKTRNKKYAGLLCPGSFFKNVLVKKTPKAALKKIDQSKIVDGKIPAGYLLESVGAKGLRQGGVSVSDFHGNFLINNGSGTCADVRKLAAKLKQKVKRQFGIELEEEVRYLA